MFTINISEIYGYMGKRRTTQRELSKRLGVTQNTLRSYFNNPDNMPYGIMIQIPAILEIPTEEAKGIFFSERLS